MKNEQPKQKKAKRPWHTPQMVLILQVTQAGTIVGGQGAEGAKSSNAIELTLPATPSGAAGQAIGGAS